MTTYNIDAACTRVDLLPEGRREALELFGRVASAALAGVCEWPVEWVMKQEGLVKRGGTWCEFGCATGFTLGKIAVHRGPATLWGFDSFRGLPETWNDKHPRGMFAQPHPPLPPDGVNLIVGWFDHTLRAFRPPEPVTFVHIDCDLYSAARTVFEHLTGGGLLAPGAVIAIDDFFTTPENGVMRALYEYQDALRWQWLVRNVDTGAIAIEVLT